MSFYMQNPNMKKKIFLEKWTKGLKNFNFSNKEMSILERQKAIKRTSDIAMASTRKPSTFWNQALLANASQDDSTKAILEHMLGSNSKIVEKASKTVLRLANNSKNIRSKKIVKKSWNSKRVERIIESDVVAKKLMKQRTQVLKNLVPGGKYLKNDSLIREALDYIDSLCVQVDVMRSVAFASEHLHSQQGCVIKPR